MKFIKSEGKHWENKQGYSQKAFLNGKDLGHSGFLVQGIKIKAGETVKENYHKKQTEIFYFFSKNGYWIVNGEKITPHAGDILIIEPLDKHIIVNNTSEDYIYLAVKLNYDSDDFYWK